MSQPKHILVIRFSAMGDVAMTVPVLRALTHQHPDVKITVVTKAFFKPLFFGLHNVEVYTADLKGEHKGILGLYKLSKELKTLKFDVVADLHNVLRSKILKFFLIGKKIIQIDKGREEKSGLVSGKEFKQLKTTHQRYAEVFEKLGFPLVLSKIIFPKKVELSTDLKTFITNPSKKLIGVAPFAAHQGKMYPLAQMKGVIKQLSEDYNIILFGGGDKETKILSEIETKHQNVVSAAGKLSFEDELKLISNLDLILSMDSGNGHLAVMFGIKVITIWGVTHPFAGFVPFNQPEEYQLTANRDKYPLIPTSIYGNTYPKDYENAAGSIPVDEVVEKVKSIIPA